MSPVLGVFGGMFDPVHDGHLEAARFAIDNLGLETVLFIPCGVPNHRAAAVSSGEHRLNMLRLATAELVQAEICDYEINKPGVSYSVDTLAWLKREAPERRLVFLIGMDAFLHLPGWHNWRQILELSNLLVLPRSGVAVSADIAAATELAVRRVGSAEELLGSDAGAIWVATDFEFNISSTDVRRQLQAGESPRCVHESVLGYIKEHRLYGQA